jgi:hypothetical protein
MKSRKAASLEPDDQPQAKRRKTDMRQNSKAESPMDLLSDDCLVSIFSNLPVDDLNTFALCNRRFGDARSSDSFSFDQSRTGTIILSEASTALSLFNAVVENNWKDVFAGNRKKLKLVGVEHLRYKTSFPFPEGLVARAQPPGTTVFDASIANNERFIILEIDDFNLFRIFPNLKELDMSNLMLVGKPMAPAIQGFCPLITRMTWKRSRCLPSVHSENDVQGLYLLKDLS